MKGNTLGNEQLCKSLVSIYVSMEVGLPAPHVFFAGQHPCSDSAYPVQIFSN